VLPADEAFYSLAVTTVIVQSIEDSAVTDTLDRLRNEAGDLAALLVVWLLLTPTVGTSGSNLLALTAFETRPLQTPLVVAGAILALLALLNRRPPVARSLGQKRGEKSRLHLPSRAAGAR